MTGVPLLVEGNALRVLIVGGGAVAVRKAQTFVAVGAHVRIVATAASAQLQSHIPSGVFTIVIRPYVASDIGDAQLVVAATNDPAVNAKVADDAHRHNRLVNVVDAPETGTFNTMAVHRSGPLVVGVSAGGVPGAATRIRDAIAARFDARYARALSALVTMRRELLARGDATVWRARATRLLDEQFCTSVEDNSIQDRAGAWR